MSLSREWAKSSYSDPNGGNCLEARRPDRSIVQIRDSKDPNGPLLTVGADCWLGFLSDAAVSAPGT